MFKIGDIAVYPSHGVGVIQSIENKKIFDNEQTFFIFRILDSDMTIMIPINNIAMVGLRRVIRLEEVPKVYDILKKKDIEIENQTWNRRYREYMQKIKSGSVFEVAEVLRDLFILKLEKDLSFGERKMLDSARNLLVKELSIAQNSSEEIIEGNIMSIFNC
ncbi:MAG: CarD family transcriptional regulator [Deltaproteobacteria bacterium CG12_big_fil_rev_8_21_14_0_65_43_10]|nr:MAG: CarD family transcriptional regulator [Deltaproteobacteria bacterium CG12_big_fil_rev_8_21_14_0_65_43_10]PIU85615.1 MAG: CarD family transcriptional regulator [Deltaproteobacteria bacterium CG06_land_8_20_14_3_00_44_19]PIZ19901.1 MAG: CarD family transcriptional regulator [Deltaproteobacteria bacterium CG_4_10_14_0_8_um_filter_43_12]